MWHDQAPLLLGECGRVVVAAGFSVGDVSGFSSVRGLYSFINETSNASFIFSFRNQIKPDQRKVKK
jgi:hypothetical protein